MTQSNENPSACGRQGGSGNLLGIVVGFAAGAFVGAVAALLYAPKPGVETRRQIRERMDAASEKAGDMLERSKEIYEETRDRALSAYESAVSRAQQAVEEARDRTKDRGRDDAPAEEA